MNDLMQHWGINGFGSLLILTFVIIHLHGNSYRLTRGSISFFSGILLLGLTIFSPINFLGHAYLFSIHMVQHILLLLIIPPLLLGGMNPDFLDKIVIKPVLQLPARFILNPVVTWLAGVGSMWIWHIPFLFRSMKNIPVLSGLHMLTLLAAGAIFAWPVFSPTSRYHLQPLQSVLYLFTACVGCTVLGIFITFAPADMYTSFFRGSDPVILNLIRNQWGLTAGADQQAGGLIMWVPACFIYITDILITLSRWYQMPTAADTSVQIKGDLK
jgi:putative membrane protein